MTKETFGMNKDLNVDFDECPSDINRDKQKELFICWNK